MSRMLPMLLFAALPLGACSPAANAPVEAAAPPADPAPAASAPAGSTPAETAPTPAPVADADAAKPQPAGASISGAIRDGNRPPPALRICATPVAGGAPTCIDSAAGARAYRIEVAPGRYYLLGWVQGGELTLIAHASRIRCIRAPCPPDTLIEIEVAAGEAKAGVDLNGGYAAVPQGWPQRP